MKNIRLIAGFVLVNAMGSCGSLERCSKGDICAIQFFNLAQDSIVIGTSTKLPDTSLVNLYLPFNGIAPNESKQISSTGWRYTINQLCPSGKIMIVLLNRDTINKYGYDDVYVNYRILKRYELSIDSLEKLNWTIVYP